jgi:predicted XRE-type DNA-binding protein
MKNLQIRAYAEQKRIRLWEIAEELKIADSQLSRMLRKELDEKTKSNVISIIDKIAQRNEPITA